MIKIDIEEIEYNPLLVDNDDYEFEDEDGKEGYVNDNAKNKKDDVASK